MISHVGINFWLTACLKTYHSERFCAMLQGSGRLRIQSCRTETSILNAPCQVFLNEVLSFYKFTLQSSRILKLRRNAVSPVNIAPSCSLHRKSAASDKNLRGGGIYLFPNNLSLFSKFAIGKLPKAVSPLILSDAAPPPAELYYVF